MLIGNESVESRLRELEAGFGGYLAAFDARMASSNLLYGEYHLKTVEARREFGSASDAIDDHRFLDLLRQTLLTWGVGIRASRLVSEPEFHLAFENVKDEISALQDECIENPALDADKVTLALWRTIDRLDIVERGIGRLTACTKALHHLLPDLVVPMDRSCTRVFFAYRRRQYETNQRAFFDLAFRSLCKLAPKVSPSQYVGGPWHT